MLLQTERDQRAVGLVRAMTERDVPALVALRQVAFRHSERDSAEALGAYFRAIFFESPWTDPDLPSLVYENADGEVAGFLGVLTRRMIANGRPVRVGIGTQLMVSPGEHALSARRLTRAFIDGPQDLSLADSANDAAKRVWASVGGHTSALLSMNWVRRVRPWQHAAQRLGEGAFARSFRWLASPACGLLDRRAHRALTNAVRATHSEPVSAESICADQDAVLSAFTLRPAYESGSLEWLLERVAEKRLFGQLHSARVRDTSGRPLGWHLYYLDAGRSAHVLQIAARRRHESSVLRHLFHDAWTHGAVTVSGRMEPWLTPTLLADDSVLVTRGPWTLMHSRYVDLAHLVENNSGYFSRMDGEWWLSF